MRQAPGWGQTNILILTGSTEFSGSVFSLFPEERVKEQSRFRGKNFYPQIDADYADLMFPLLAEIFIIRLIIICDICEICGYNFFRKGKIIL
jgi:hypothetical protein